MLDFYCGLITGFSTVDSKVFFVKYLGMLHSYAHIWALCCYHLFIVNKLAIKVWEVKINEKVVFVMIHYSVENLKCDL